MKSKNRTFIVGFLYVVALFSFLGAITATSRGSMLYFSNLARLIFCGLAVICVIAATLIWKATDARGKRNKIIVMLVAIAVIISGGLIDTFFSAPGRGTLEYVSVQFPFGVTDMERIEAYHYDGVPVNAEKKTVTDTQTMTYLYETFNSLMLQEKEVEELTGASVTSFRFVLKDGTEYNLIYVGNGVKSGKLKRNDGTSYFTSADIGQMWVNLSGEAVPADESELPTITNIPAKNLLELSEVSGYVLEKGYTQKQIEEKLKGEFRNDIIASWGEPDGMLSGFWGDMWYLDDKDDMRITLYYDNEGYVMGVHIISTVEENKLIYGETDTDDIPLDKEDMVIEQVGVLTEPPEMTVVCNGKQITALRGTYSWEYQNEDGTSTAIEADSMHPLEAQEFMPDLPLEYSAYSSVSSFRAYLQFLVAPDELEIVYWNTNCWGDVSADKTVLPVKTVEIDFEDGSWGVDYSADLIHGQNIYEIIARWNSSEEYSGVAHYSFYTTIGDYKFVPDGE